MFSFTEVWNDPASPFCTLNFMTRILFKDSYWPFSLFSIPSHTIVHSTAVCQCSNKFSDDERV